MKKMIRPKKNSLTDYGLMGFAFLIYSCCSIFSKLAAKCSVLSLEFLFFYGMVLGTLAVYAIVWQQVLKRFDLSLAYAGRPIATILAMLWGVVLFHERITWNMLLGSLIIVLGIWIIVMDEEK